MHWTLHRAGLTLVPIQIGATLLLSSCGAKEQTFNAPDPAKVIQATSQVKNSQKAAHEAHQKERESIRLAQANADALGVTSVSVMKKLDALALRVTPELQPAVAAIHVDIADLQKFELLLNQNLAAAWERGDVTEKRLDETDARIAELEQEHGNYYSEAQAIADTASALSLQVVELKKKVSWYRWHWWGSWIACGAGALVFLIGAILKFTGRLSLKGAAIAAKVAI